MRYRKQDANGDFVFGHSAADFFVDEPGAVAQAIATRLKLWLGEYFLDTTIGMPWQSQVLGRHPAEVYDAAIRDCIAETIGFANFVSYKSSLDSVQRILTVDAVVNSVYSGTKPVHIVVPITGYGVGPYGERPYGE